ncbi:MAG: response regulator transcription factor [Xenococcaceae cyanobacterium MO_207.B15]|nr:response regulator transcription factor [Xenococcaceae cyanobacterium MO_207.B15]
MKKILVVDDDKILQTVLKHTLEQQGYKVTVGSSGKEALVLFQEDSPDIIISDVSMPEMDGFDFCRQLRSQPSGQLIPFIFLSARGELDDRVFGHSIGADDYLTKPFQMKELLAKIEALIERSRRIHAEIVHLIGELVNSSSKLTGQDNINAFSKFVIDSSPAKVSQPPVPLPLTPAEERVFWEVIQGFTNKQISERLFISPRTVQTHLSNILSKLNLENRTQLVRFAFENGYEKVGQ